MHLLLSIILLNGILGNTKGETIDLKPGVEYELNSENYPEQASPNLKQSWQLRCPPESKIHLNCYDIRLIQDNPPGCDDDVLIIDDGQEKQSICGEKYDLDLTTPSNLLNVELKTGELGGGGVKCTAKIRSELVRPNEPPTLNPVVKTLNLKAGGDPETLTTVDYPEPYPANSQQSWFITTSPESTIRITCTDIRTRKPNSGTECGDEALTVVDGDNVQELCGAIYDFTKLSSSNSLTVHFRSGKSIGGGVKCEVRGKVMDWYGEATPPPTTTTPPPPPRTTPPPYLGIESEEIDSSEHGGPPGKKTTTCQCGWTNKPSKRIVNGVETGINEFPWTVAVIDPIRKYQFCGGSIITPRHALTAAHCTVSFVASGKPIAIVVGDHNLYIDEETNATEIIDVERIIQHPDYVRYDIGEDISLLLLARKVEFTKFVGPACLSPVRLDLARKYVKEIGWGRLAWNGPSSDTLQKVNARVIHLETCHSVYPTVSIEKACQICTYAEGRATCQGDSGGPVVWLDPETNRYTLVGLVSFATICANKDPSVSADVSAYYNWIEENIKATVPEELCIKQS